MFPQLISMLLQVPSFVKDLFDFWRDYIALARRKPTTPNRPTGQLSVEANAMRLLIAFLHERRAQLHWQVAERYAVAATALKGAE